jgi:cation diffusion facilitator CzcD-associated flavoprotein CzcO
MTATTTRPRASSPRASKRNGGSGAITHDTLIIGAGFTGLGTAIKLLEAGVEDFVILDRSDRVGGTWRDNTYPGAACDIPSLLYSFSFAKNPNWSRAYSPSDEIREHIEELVERFDLKRFIRFQTTVESLAFDEHAGAWDITTSDGAYRARTVIVASGPLADSSFPAMTGIDNFEGKKILSSKWDHDYDMTGKNVAVIGTGASAIQIIPELVKTAASVKVFQRTPGWVMPRLDVATPKLAQKLFATVPATQQAARTALYFGHEAAATGLVWNTPVTSLIQRIGIAHLHHQVKDPWLRRQLTPDFRAGCKRMLMSSDYYPALQQPNCKLITWPIATISPNGIRTSDAIEHDVDCIVFATGYDVHLDGPPYPVTGLGGRSLQAEWAGGAQGYKSASAHGYPNLFFTTGPNSGPGHNSLLVYVQGQIDYAVAGVRAVLDGNLRYLDVRDDVQKQYNQRLQKRLKHTTWMTGCSSWYLTKDGFNASMYPGFATQYLRQMKNFRLADYTAVAQTQAVTRLSAVS